MSHQVYNVVVDQDGVRGVFEADQLHQTQILITAEGDKKAMVSRSVLELRDDGTYYLPLSLTALNNQHSEKTQRFEPLEDNVQAVLPVIEEEISIYKKWVETGRVRVSKVVREEEQVVTEALLKEEVDVERVPINRVIDEPVQTRYEEDTLIIPLVEEILVIEKRYLLKEELRVTKRRIETPTTQTVTVRKEEAVVERVDRQGNANPNDVQTS